MKYKTNSKLLIIFICCLAVHNPARSMAAFSVVKKGVEIAGHVATVVDVAMNIANIGVTLWGNDKDKERMAKAMGITGIITSLARGDIEGAQAAADTIKGAPTRLVYEPLLADQLADADIIPIEENTGRVQRSVGDITPMPPAQLVELRNQQRVITVEELKIAQFSDIKNQLVFIATEIPQNANQMKLYKLLNGIEILFQNKLVQDNTAYIVIKRLAGSHAVELGSIRCSLDQLQKGLFIGTTNGELSIFFKDGNLIKKTILMNNMNQLETVKNETQGNVQPTKTQPLTPMKQRGIFDRKIPVPGF